MPVLDSDLFRGLDPVPEEFWAWAVEARRTAPADADGNVLRDTSGQPIECPVTAYASLRCAVVDVGPQDAVLFAQQGVTLTHQVYFPTILAGGEAGKLPDVRVGDWLVLGTRPSGEERVLSVRKVDDVLLAGRLLCCGCEERVPGDQRQVQD